MKDHFQLLVVFQLMRFLSQTCHFWTTVCCDLASEAGTKLKWLCTGWLMTNTKRWSLLLAPPSRGPILFHNLARSGMSIVWSTEQSPMTQVMGDCIPSWRYTWSSAPVFVSAVTDCWRQGEHSLCTCQFQMCPWTFPLLTVFKPRSWDRCIASSARRQCICQYIEDHEGSQ